jgi:ubiquinol-cytochrome c reductase subunit 6
MSDSTALASQAHEEQHSLFSSVASFFSSVLPSVKAEEEGNDAAEGEDTKDNDGGEGEGGQAKEEEEEEEEEEPEDVSFVCSLRPKTAF